MKEIEIINSEKTSSIKKRITKIVNYLLLITLTSIIINSCSSPSEPAYNPEPGRRDYVWTVDTLLGLNSPRGRMWGSSPTDVWATSSSNWNVSISHYNGIKWTSYGIPGIVQPNSVYGFSSSEIYVGDENGKIWKYNGSSWQLIEQIRKEGVSYFLFENIWGESSNDIFAVGCGPDHKLLANVSIIAHRNHIGWRMLDADNLIGNVVRLYKNKPDNKIYLRLVKIGGIVHVDSTIIYEYINGKYKNIYSSLDEKGSKADISLIYNEVYFILGNDIAIRKYDHFKTIIKVNNPNFYQRIWGRSSKDIFLLMTDGLAHYNGSDIEYLFYFNVTPQTQIYGASLFENEVFFLTYEAKTGLSLVYRGILKKE